jgi:isocitrate dehydrogenase (NAD+)
MPPAVHTVTLIPGDGIGPEITAAVLDVLNVAGAGELIRWERRSAGMEAFRAGGNPLPVETLDSIRATRVALKGPLETPVGAGFRSVNVALRQEFDLYANVRPARTMLSGWRFSGVDIVLIRENTEGLYSGVEHYIRIGDDPRAAAESVAIATRHGSERIVRFAFEYALAHGRKRVTLVHKANILRMASGLFLEAGRNIAREYDGRVSFDDRIVDAMAMQLVVRPEAFDVIVTSNLFGDILSDLIAGVVGGLGVTPGANIGRDAAIFEAVHGTAPDIAGKNAANPAALLLAACLMLDHVGEADTATRIRAALEHTLRDGRTLTRDLGGSATTSEFAAAISARLMR